jgi:hypothetical protein
MSTASGTDAVMSIPVVYPVRAGLQWSEMQCLSEASAVDMLLVIYSMR